jgi:hypothetical protein
MRTALIVLIVLVRFGPDIVFAAGAAIAPRTDATHSADPAKTVRPPADVQLGSGDR